jgi:D-alanine transaminase
MHLYVQVSRGAEFGRNHAWPDGLAPTLFAYATALDTVPEKTLAAGVAAITAVDTRWARRDIKSTALLANVLLKRLAVDAGAFETILLEGGHLTEGSSTSVHIVANGSLHAPPNGTWILPGTTRDVVTELAAALGIESVARAVTEAELRGADEILLSFATRGILPVTRLDGRSVGSGVPGPVFRRLHDAFLAYRRGLTGVPPL